MISFILTGYDDNSYPDCVLIQNFVVALGNFLLEVSGQQYFHWHVALETVGNVDGQCKHYFNRLGHAVD